MRRTRVCQRGIALVTVLLTAALLLVVIAVMVDLGTVQLRRAVEDLRGLQAQAGADAGVGWVRALLYQNRGDVGGTLSALASQNSSFAYQIDDDTSVSVHTSIELANASTQNDHQDVSLQKNAQVNEVPLQVVAAATLRANGVDVAHRTSTALLRVFAHASPYSEVVGVIDNAGPVGIDSPGDPAGQASGFNATDLRIHAYVQNGTSTPQPADNYQDAAWSDGNAPNPGALP